MYLSSGRNPLIWTVAYLLALCATGHPLHIREEGKEIPSGELGLFMEIPKPVDMGSQLKIKIKLKNLSDVGFDVVREPWGILQEDKAEKVGDALEWLNQREAEYIGGVEQPKDAKWLDDWVSPRENEDEYKEKIKKRLWRLEPGKDLEYEYEAGKAYDFSKKGIGRFFFKLKRSTLYITKDKGTTPPTETRLSEVRYDVFVKSDQKEEKK